MAKYAAVCNRFPELQIGVYKFENGSFETDDEELWAQLQKNEWWGVFIHPRDVPPPPEGGEPPSGGESGPGTPSSEETSAEKPEESSHSRVHRGQRGTR